MALGRDMAPAGLKLAFGRRLPSHVDDTTLDASRTVMQGRERVITVLMADLNDLTSFCAAQRDRPEAIVAALNRRFCVAQTAIDRFGGCLDTFDGDAVIAFWNGVEPQPDYARRAVDGTLALVEADRQDRGAPLTFEYATEAGVALVGRYGPQITGSPACLDARRCYGGDHAGVAQW